MIPTRHIALAINISALLSLTAIHAEAGDTEIDYSQQIRPLLSNSCYACHGPDRTGQDNELRLDVRDQAVEAAIVPGDADASELLERLTSDDPDIRMPPPDANKPALTAEQIALVRGWIEQGAVFSRHWSYAPLQRPVVPEPESEWPLNSIDNFVLARNSERSVSQAPAADRRTLIRRLSFDLTGLAPDPKRVIEFVQSDSATAYADLVHEFLQSNHFGERMASFWLDLVRFADTCGYHGDQHREIAAYRDFVIDAFNSNLPFDEFTRFQIAGDLLPNASQQQLIASGYNRLLQTTEEGGAQPKEYRAIYAADRVRNASTVWLGSTLGCAQCHDHKFDPFTMQDFYQFAAFFADIEEAAVGRQNADLELPTRDQKDQRQELQQRVNEAKGQIADLETKIKGVAEGEKDPALEQRLSSLREELKAVEGKLQQLSGQIRRTLMAKSGQVRVTRVLPRGNWLDESGPVVQADIPSLFGSLTTDGAVPNRTDLARWMTARDNPLTPRVFVNHLWRLMFGEGLIRTPDDLGRQGEYPTHPLLLDWLASEFVDSGWDVKHLVKLIVTSQTYQQSSRRTSRLVEEDPQNRWLARQNRFRLEAEMIRDSALLISGLLIPETGGNSVKPYQPAGYSAQLNFPKRTYQADQGNNQYRRGVYTYWCRTFLHPSLAAFDAPTREECTAQRARSNTPLQALVRLNDPTYVESARVFGQRILSEAQGDSAARIHWAFGEILNRRATGSELAVVQKVFDAQLERYQDDVESAKKLLSVGQSTVGEQTDPAELSAWTSVARVLLNLHESITRY